MATRDGLDVKRQLGRVVTASDAVRDASADAAARAHRDMQAPPSPAPKDGPR